MAITKIHPITTTLSKAIDYIQNSNKTDDKILISGYACTPSIAVFQFNQVKEKVGKRDGILAEHLIQSFVPGEVDSETAHRIGIELADRILKGRFQYVIATHIDKGHIHNHIIWNSVSFKDHKKYHSTPNSYYYIQRTSDIICKGNGLSIIDKPKDKGKSHYEHLLDRKGQSWKSKLRQTIDFCILKAKNWDEFLILMDKEKYEIKHGKYISFRAEGQERFTRSKTLGEKYTEDNIRKRIAGEAVQNGAANNDIGRNLIIDIENNIKVKQSVGYANWARKYNLKLVAETVNYLSEHNLLDMETLDKKISELSDVNDNKRERLKTTEKRIKILEEQIHDIDFYRKTKPVVEGVPKHFGKDKYRNEHETEFILYAAAERSLKKHFNGCKLPLIKELRTEQKKLRTEVEKLKNEIRDEKPQLDELKNMRRNIEMFLGHDNSQSHERKPKRTGELE